MMNADIGSLLSPRRRDRSNGSGVERVSQLQQRAGRIETADPERGRPSPVDLNLAASVFHGVDLIGYRPCSRPGGITLWGDCC
jgi:hypothetical protein